MRKNNKQQQKSQEKCQLSFTSIHETSLSHKLLELDFQIQQTEKVYQVTKKPFYYFTPLKKSIAESKNNKKNIEPGILSEKFISCNLGQILQNSQKPSILQKTKLKNVFEAYKQALEQKYRKKIKQMEKTDLNINSGKSYSNQAPCHKKICQKQYQIKKLSSKKLDSNMLGPYQTPTCNRSSLIKNYRQRKISSRLLSTINDPIHNFICHPNRNSDIKIALDHESELSNQQVSLYQVKRKCYTDQENESYEDNNILRKTRNLSFRLPNNREKKMKHLMQKLGHQACNLPELNNLNPVSQTISYLVKSLRKPSLSQNSKPSKQGFIYSNSLQKIQSQSEQKQKPKEYNSRYLDCKSIILEEDMLEKQEQSFGNDQKIEPIKAMKNISNYNHKKSKIKKKLIKSNPNYQIQGWITENQHSNNSLYHNFIFAASESSQNMQSI